MALLAKMIKCQATILMCVFSGNALQLLPEPSDASAPSYIIYVDL